MENLLTTKLQKIAKNQSLLLVDDDLIALETLQSLTKFFYKTVDCALNGEEALKLYKQNHYDIIVTDIIMPIKNGVELTKEIREINSDQIIIIISAHSESQHLLELINIGVDKFLKKPINNNILTSLYKESKKIEDNKLLSKYRRDFKEEIQQRRTSILCAIKSLEFKTFLEKQDFDTDFINIKDLYKFVEFEEPNLIILDDRIANVKFIINDIRSSKLTRHIPIAILSSKENKSHNKQLIVLGIEEIIPYELPNEKILKIITRIIEREKYSNSYSGCFIRGLQAYESSRIHGIKLRTITKVVCLQYSLEIAEVMDIKRVLSLLSTTLEGKKISELISFFKNMRLSTDIREHLESFEKPQKLSHEIIKGIYYTYYNKYNNQKSQIAGVREEILTLVEKCLEKNTVIVQRPTDIDFLYVTITDILTENKKIDLFISHDLINIVSGIANNFILSKESILIHTTMLQDNSIEVVIETQNKLDFQEYLEDIIFPQNLTTTIEENTLKIATQTKEKAKLKEESIEVEVVEKIQKREREVLSATDFIERLYNENIDFDILEELAELEDDLDGIASKEVVTIEIVESVTSIVIKYARFIESIMEFHEISSSLYSLSTILGRVQEKDLQHLDKSILAFLEGILYDIKSWREGIFVYKTVEDIHFLDASFISNCTQIEMFLSPPDTKKDLSSDDILFF